MADKPFKKDWVLTKDAFEKLLNSLNGDPGIAAVRYESLRLKLMRFFGSQGSVQPEEHADEVFNRVARHLAEGEPLELAESDGYFMQTARFLLKEHFRDIRRSYVPLEDLTPDLEPNEDPLKTTQQLQERIEHEIGLQALEDCRSKLKPAEKEMLDVYDLGSGGEKIVRRNALASKLGKTKSTLIVAVSRTRNKLKDCARLKLAHLFVSR